MLRGVSLILLLGTGSYTVQDLSDVSCKAVGSWGCGTDEICIDTSAHRGEKYRIDFKRMVFQGPNGRLSMQPAADADKRREWQLSNGARLSSMGRIEHPSNEKGDYDRYWLFAADRPHSPIEIWCAASL